MQTCWHAQNTSSSALRSSWGQQKQYAHCDRQNKKLLFCVVIVVVDSGRLLGRAAGVRAFRLPTRSLCRRWRRCRIRFIWPLASGRGCCRLRRDLLLGRWRHVRRRRRRLRDNRKLWRNRRRRCMQRGRLHLRRRRRLQRRRRRHHDNVGRREQLLLELVLVACCGRRRRRCCCYCVCSRCDRHRVLLLLR